MIRLVPVLAAAALAGCIPGVDSPRPLLTYDMDGVLYSAQQEYRWPEMVRSDAGEWVRSGRSIPAVVVDGPRSFAPAVEVLLQFCGWYEVPKGLTEAGVYYDDRAQEYWFSGVLCE